MRAYLETFAVLLLPHCRAVPVPASNDGMLSKMLLQATDAKEDESLAPQFARRASSVASGTHTLWNWVRWERLSVLRWVRWERLYCAECDGSVCTALGAM